MDVLSLEAAKGGPFVFQHEGATLVLPDPADLPLGEVLAALRSDGRSLTHQIRMPDYKRRALMRAWAGHYDLGHPRDVERLMYLLQKYGEHLEFDLRVHAAGVDMGDLWRSRRWRYLLNLIDHLPRHSYYRDAEANDPEHAALIAKAQADRAAEGEETKTPRVPLISWTPEVAAIADLIDSVNSVTHTLRVVNSDPKKQPPKAPARYPRPTTAIEGATKSEQFKRREAAHNALVKRLIRRPESEVKSESAG